VTGFLVWLPFYVLGWIGAGDVKLAAACGAWLGMHGVLRASAVAAMVGGVLALAMLVYRRSPRLAAADVILLIHTIRSKPSSVRIRADGPQTAQPVHLMPYGVALVIGALAVGWSIA
jgi:prepilin peptidase CpaA